MLWQRSAPNAGMTVREAHDRQSITRISEGCWIADGCGSHSFKTGGEALRAYADFQTQREKQEDAEEVAAWHKAAVKAVRDGDTVILTFPDGTVQSMTIRQYRQNVFDICDKYDSVEVIDKKQALEICQ